MAGLHTNILSDQALAFIQHTLPPVNLLLKPKGEESGKVKAASPASLLIGRPDVGPDTEVHSWYLAGDPTAAGQRAAAICLQYQASNPAVGAWVLNNEPPVKSIEQLTRLAAFDIAFARSMKAAGSRAVIGTFARGTPEGPDIDGGAALRAYLPALRVAEEIGALVAFHQYGYDPLLHEADWHILRWQRQILPWLAAKAGLRKFEYFISETGCDLGTGRKENGQVMDGWRVAFGDSPEGREAYATQLHAVVTEYMRDPRCVGATIFCSGNESRWETFDVNGPLLDRLTAMSWPKRAIAPAPVVPAPTPPVVPTPKPPATGGGSTVAPIIHQFTKPLSVHYSDRLGRAIQYLILHTTESPVNSDEEETLNYLVKNDRKVSINDYLARFPDGSIRLYHMVPYNRAAHHAGGVEQADGTYSSRLPNGYRGHECNMRTIGLEIYRRVDMRLTSDVVEAAIEWAVERCKQYNLTTSQILSHAQVDPSRRSDPIGIDIVWFRDRVGEKLGAMTEVVLKPPLPEDESLADLKVFLQKATYWAEEELRQYASGQWARASAIRASLAKYLAAGRDKFAK